MKKLLIILGVIAGLFVLTCAGGFTFLFWLGAQSPDNVAITVDAPDAVSVGENFQIAINVTDTSGATRQIGDVDIQESLLQGIRIDSIDPRGTKGMSVFGYQTYNFDDAGTVPPNGTFSILLDCTAVEAAGLIGGDIDIYIDSTMVFETYRLTISVTE